MQFSLNIASTILLMTVSATAIGAVPEDSLRAAAAGRLSMVADAELAINPVTSAVRHARFQPGVVVSDGTTITEKAELFLVRYGQAFGVDAPGIELEQIRERIDGLGHTHLVFDQVHRGVPVFGARMGLHFDSSGELIAANANVVPDIEVRLMTPDLTEERARGLALLLVAKQQGVIPTDLEVSQTELVIFHDGVIWGRQGDAHLTWHLEVTD